MTELGLHIRTQKGFAFKSEWYTDIGIPIIKVSDFTEDSVDDSNLTCIPNGIAEGFYKHILKKGDVVIQTVGSWPSNPKSVVGKVIKIPNKVTGALLNQNAVRLDPFGGLDRQFMYYLLRSDSFKRYIVGCAQGAASQASITLEDIRRFQFQQPPLPTQRKISAILSAYDDLIENNTRRIKILEEMAQAIYREWFVHFRFPGHEGGKMVETELGLVPEGWEVKKLGEISTFFRGKSYRSPELAKEGGYPFLNLKCIDRDGGFRRNGLKRFIGDWKLEQSATPGDIIIALTDMTQERRIVARAARVPNIGEEPFVMSMDIIKIMPKYGINRAYLYAMLRYSSFPNVVKQHANGVNVLHLNPDRIRDFNLHVPLKGLQNQFGEIAEAIFTQGDLLAQKNDILVQSRDLLLPKLVSGEIDVGELEIQLEQK